MSIRRSVPTAVALVLMSVVAPAGAQTRLSPARFWCDGVAAAPRIPLLGDADGDGRADLLAFSPNGDASVDYVRTSAAGKPCWLNRARSLIGKNAVAAVCAPFIDPKHAVVLALHDDGSVRLTCDMKPGTRTFAHDGVAGKAPVGALPRPPMQAAAGDFDGDGRPDALVVGADGRTLLLRNAGGDPPRFDAAVVDGRRSGIARLAAGDLRGQGRTELVWLDRRGVCWRAGLEPGPVGGWRWARPMRVATAAPGDGLAVGRFRGGPAADIVVGRRLLPGGDAASAVALPNLPATDARGDVAWLAGDLNGDGRDDLVRVRRSGQRFVGDDVFVHFSTAGPEAETALLDSDNDGLLDSWESGAVKPGGLDLAALGCSPGHRDIVVEVQRMPDMPEERTRTEMERVARYYAGLPVANPDGKTGIALHVIYREPIAREDMGKPWWELGDKYHPSAHRGVSHWMVVYNGGGGQSGMMTDHGGCGGSALYATFIHEFGHQLGLDHNGFWSAGSCPIYPSLMNYSYSYQLNGKDGSIGYSDGRLAALTLDERHLSELLPLPMEQVAFIGGPPYRFRLKAAPDGKGTLVDWNWNGVFGETNVAADINYGYSTTAGLRHHIGKTYTAPAPAVVGKGRAERLLLFVGELPAGTAVPASSAAEPRHSLSTALAGRLCVRLWQGSDPAKEGARWSAETEVEPAGVVGDPSAAALDHSVWVAYPTTDGVKVRPVTVDAAGAIRVGAVTTVPESAGAQPTLTAFAGGLALLLWRDARTPVAMRLLAIERGAVRVRPEAGLGFTSMAPVGAAEGARGRGGRSLWVGLSQDQDAARPTRWQMRRFSVAPDGTARQVSMEWIGGEKGGERGPTRICLLWKADRALGKDGQLYLFGGGLFGSGSPWSCHYVVTRVADKTVNGGWLTRRYYDEWTCSRSAPGVCFRGDDIFFSCRWFGNVHGTENDDVFVAYYGSGIEAEPMGDFDDIGFVRDIGLSHSIPWIAQ